ncbi:hypothetical protein [Alistipes sp.]|uniref:hypothetical protein n=1 Tax=Alistipes sp. TaxID=1872444 RepID=UPI003AF1D0E7
MKKRLTLSAAMFCAAPFGAAAQPQTPQIPIALVERMPDLPSPYKIKDWRAIACEQDRLLYNFDARGALLPLGWWDDSGYNFRGRAFGIASYVGQTRSRRASYVYESLPVMGSIIGATLAGIDKSDQRGVDYVSMIRQFYTRRSGLNLIQNSPNRTRTGESFWYEIFPGMAFSMICDLYPDNRELSSLMLSNAGKWLEAVRALSRGRDYPDFDWTGYDFETGAGRYNGRWREPDAAAGVAWLEYAAWRRSGDEKFLAGALACLRFLDERDAAEGPYYEIMLPWGACLAVRLNAERGTAFDERKMLAWCFDGHNTDRDGWGVVADRWNGYDVHGLVGQKKYEGYAFAMNTFSQIAALVPVVKYNAAYSHAIAKWVLNAVNAARLFYADEHPRNRQTSALWQGDPAHAICYEGLRSSLRGNRFEPFLGVLAPEGPYAVGDHLKNYQSYTDLCPYGSAWSGMLAGIVQTTDVEGILQLDCNATDFFGDRSLPHYLVFNPHPENRLVAVKLPQTASDLYDLVSGRYVARNVTETVRLDMAGRQTLNLVCIPAGRKLRRTAGRLAVGQSIVDYRQKCEKNNE